MARQTGIINQADVRNLDPNARAAAFGNKHLELTQQYGHGVFNTIETQNGDIAWTFDYADQFTAAPAKSHLSAGLSPEEVEAVYHARVLLCNKGHVVLTDGVYSSTTTAEEDPAIPQLMTTINTLEQLLQEYERGTITA